MVSEVQSKAPNRLLNSGDIRTLGLSSLGGALEFYDFIIFVFYAALISEQFFPKELDPFWATLNTWGIFAAGYFFRPVGGIVMAHFGDKIGRKRTFMLSILLMALPTMLIGLLPTFASIGYAAPLLLLFMRIVQGIAVGGEVPASWTFVSEHVPAHHVGLANGAMCAGLNLGVLLGSLMALFVEKTFTATEISGWAWRLPFLVGGALGFLAVFLRLWLHETPIFKEMQERKQLYPGLPLKAVLTQHGKTVILGMLMTWMLTACILVAVLYVPQWLSKAHQIPKATAFVLQSWGIVAGMVGLLVLGHACDRFGPGKVLIAGGIVMAICCRMFFTHAVAGNMTQMGIWYIAMGFMVGMVAAVPMGMVKGFPAPVRLTGVSFSYNVCYAICGGVTFPLITILGKYTDLAAMWYLLAICVLAIGCGLYMLRLFSVEKPMLD